MSHMYFAIDARYLDGGRCSYVLHCPVGRISDVPGPCNRDGTHGKGKLRVHGFIGCNTFADAFDRAARMDRGDSSAYGVLDR